MKTKKKLRIVPFIISLFIVIGATLGISLYSYNKWSINRVDFLDDYFSEKNHKSKPVEQLIEKAVQWDSQYYQKDPAKLSYRDPVTKKEYTEIKNTDITDETKLGVYYSDGVIHIPGYFDITLYAMTYYSSETEEWIINYTYFLSNIVYSTKDFDPKKVNIVFVKGIGEDTSGDTGDTPDPDETLIGDAALKEALNKIKKNESGGATPASPYSYSFSFGGTYMKSYTIYDDGADDTFNADANHYVHTLNPRGDLTNKEDFRELEELTFSIYYQVSSDDSSTDIKELVQGTIANKPTAEKFNEGTNVMKGYITAFSNAGYAKYIWPKILLHSAIAFVVSGAVAVLFYLIWQEEEQNAVPKAAQKNKLPSNKKKQLK